MEALLLRIAKVAEPEDDCSKERDADLVSNILLLLTAEWHSQKDGMIAKLIEHGKMNNSSYFEA